jgi:hypothetical protein
MRDYLSRKDSKEPWLFPSIVATVLSWASVNFKKSMTTTQADSRCLFDISATDF